MTGRPAWRDRAIWRRARRESLGLARETVAARLGLTVKQLTFYETGVNKPTVELARAWDDALYREVD